MQYPVFRMKRNGVPVLSRAQIDAYALSCVRAFQPALLTDPAPVPVEAFVEGVLDLSLEYRYLSNNGRYLGMMVFTDCLIPVWEPETDTCEPCAVSAGTVVADNALLEDEASRPRYRFTLAHEAGHALYHATAFRNLGANQTSSLFLCESEPTREEDRRDRWTDFDWLEWQSDTFASCFLMPRDAVLEAAHLWRLGRHNWGQSLSATLAQVFDVSLQAARIRLKDLGLQDQQTPFRPTLTDDMMILEPDDTHGTYF